VNAASRCYDELPVKHARIALTLAVLLASGCQDPAMKGVAERAQKRQDYESRRILVPDNFPRPTKAKKKAEPSQESLDVIARAYDATRATSRLTGRSEEVAVTKVGAAIRASLELGPTLVVWIIDRTPSAQKIVSEAAAPARAFYDEEDIRGLSLDGVQQLLTAVIAFDEEVEFLLEPSDDCGAVQAVLDRIEQTESGREQTFTAIRQALDKYLPLRTDAESPREVLLVVISDEAGDDANLVDDLAAIARRHAVPIYCLGSPAPWGQVNPLAADPKKGDPTKTDDSAPRYGPESFASERVDIAMAGAAFSYGEREARDITLVDSGFGPFALERLCRAGGGQFLPIRPEAGSQDKHGGQTYDYWPAGNELRFSVTNLSTYAPDYVSAEEHARLVAGSKARQALLAAAQLPPLAIMDSPDFRFPKAAEAQMKRQLDKAQQFAARYAPLVDRFYESLAPGEADADELRSFRIRAEYQLAYGRVLAIKARIDGYNSMLAALKRGKTFADPASTEWVLEPSPQLDEVESSIRKLAEKGELHLKRVRDNHAGTPWAEIAAEELRSPLGWKWKES
jgi:hypothetical protein